MSGTVRPLAACGVVPKLDGELCGSHGNGTIHVGTGSSFENAGGEGGSGFRRRFRTSLMFEDNGATWTMVSNTDGYDATNALEADPTNPDRVWYASVDGWLEASPTVCWWRCQWKQQSHNASDVAIAPDGSLPSGGWNQRTRLPFRRW